MLWERGWGCVVLRLLKGSLTIQRNSRVWGYCGMQWQIAEFRETPFPAQICLIETSHRPSPATTKTIRPGAAWDVSPSQARLIIWRSFQPIFLKLFGDLQQGWQIFLRARSQIWDNFLRNSLGCWKPEFTGTVFPIIPVVLAPLIGWSPGAARPTVTWAVTGLSCSR